MNRPDTPIAESVDLADEELIRRAQRGDLDAFTALYDRYLPVVYRRVRYVIPERDVEDVTQEIFIAVMRSLQSFKRQAKFSTWLRTLVNRRVADYYRQRRSVEAQESVDLNDTGEYLKPAAGSHNPLSADDKIALRNAINSLPEQYQDILLLRFAEGLRFHEIAVHNGQSLEATKSLFRRAIAALRAEMGEFDD